MSTGRDTIGQAVDSSATVVACGKRPNTSVLNRFRNAIASRFSRPPYFVRNPAAGGPAVVEIEHRGDGIDAQAVDAVAIEPEQRAREQEIGDFGAAVIVDQRAPIEMPSLPRVGMLVERGAVEPREAVGIVREMPGHPIENDAKSGAVAGVDQRCEVRRRPEPAGRREHAPSADSPRSHRTDVR